jgi:hypothetical protein
VQGEQSLDSRMIKILIHAIVLNVILVGSGCALFLAKETRYLLSATNQATQQEVRQHLGQPFLITSTKAGETVWAYHIREFVQGSNNAWTMTGDWWCDEYVLTFDVSGILRDWTHTSQKCG